MSTDAEHGLRVELATALRERDAEREFRGAAEAAFAEQLSRTEAGESERDTLRAEVKRLRERDDCARAMLIELRKALEEDTTFLGAILRVEMDKWLGRVVAVPIAGEPKTKCHNCDATWDPVLGHLENGQACWRCRHCGAHDDPQARAALASGWDRG